MAAPVGLPAPVAGEQAAWLKAHPIIRVGVDPAWPPFSGIDPAGKCTGIDVDLLARFGRDLGVRFEIGTRQTWEEVYAAAQRGEFDLLAGTAVTGERKQHFTFTEPYFSFPVVVVSRVDEPLFWSLADLQGRTLVGVRGYAPTSEIQRLYPSIRVQLVDTTEQALHRVAEGEADGFISNLPNVSSVAKTHGLTNLKVAGVLPETFDLRYAVRPDWPELARALDTAVANLSEEDRLAIVHPWIRVDYAKVIRWDLVWKTALTVLSVLAVVLAAILYHNRRLARELAERIRLQRQIEEARDELLHMNAEKTELLQMAAHDLRGPLTGMQLVVDASLRLNAVPRDDALMLIEKQVRQMTGLLNNLLDSDALEHGRRAFQLQAVDAMGLLHEALGMARTLAEPKEISFDCSGLPAALPLVRSDPTALRQILDNLLSNAVKFSPRQTTVAVRAEDRGAQVRIEVHDQGPGVAPQETERIFVKYARGSARPTAGEKSTGLGLSIVRQLATAMNGRIWCESSPHGGVFILVIPVAPMESPALAPGVDSALA